MKKYIPTFLLILLSFASCVKYELMPEMENTEHTLFIYMPWSTDLTGYFERNIKDFEDAVKQDILKNSRVIVFFMSSSKNAAMFELKYNHGECFRDTLKKYVNPVFTTDSGITAILSDMKGFAPAERYSMIISSHGLGWIPVGASSLRSAEKYHWEHENVPSTRFYGGQTQEYQVDISTLAKGIVDAGMKMDYILFDDCYMSSIEVAYDLKDATGYLIGCPTEVMAYGYPYTLIAKYLVGDFDLYGITNGFITFYENYTAMPCGTIGVTDCSELESLAEVMKEINTKYDFNQEEVNTVQRMDGYSPVIFFDYGDYVSKLCKDEELLRKFEAQMELTVPSAYRRHTRTYYSMKAGQVTINSYSGVTTSDPSDHSITASKSESAWYKATH